MTTEKNTGYDSKDTRDEAALRRIVINLKNGLTDIARQATAARDGLDKGHLPGSGMRQGAFIGREASELDALAGQLKILCELVQQGQQERYDEIIRTAKGI